MIKLVLSDIDGTITDSRRVLSSSASEQMRKVQDSGVIVSLVSGNVIPVMYTFRTYLGIKAPLFAENGGTMIEDDITQFFNMDRPMAFFRNLEKKGLVKGIMTNQWRLCSMGFELVGPVEREIMQLSAQYNVEITNSGFSWHILNVGQNKGFALHYLMERYALRPEEVLVIGDNLNDIPMFIEGVRKAVPANAEEELKKRADYIARSGYGAGSAEILSSLDSF
ncbi:MAG: phosphoglycolate phosphatase [Candidatus Thermoplasmatota archaeon]|jgi:phosphoglycolate phosphatase (TIGR01487 family)|nr:phosphoglycolate phosphatase [Candidatus Thermoplasmatota archaeon]MCL5732489.1 phosphoglycolate phosphatase [Candidatus Thermoplasmatota archaeon]